MNPKISVIIPTYNEEKLIGKCLMALKAQDMQKNLFEVILVDGNSTDNTVKIASEYNIRIIKLKNTPTIGSTRQAGIDKANGQILAFIDADIQVSSDWLEQIAYCFTDNNLICVGGEIQPDTNNKLLFLIYKIYSYFIITNQIIFNKILIWGSNMAVRTNAFKEIGGFNLNMEMSEDWDLGRRLQEKFGIKSVKYNPEIIAKTSIRKQKNLSIFGSYLLAGLLNYFSFAILNANKTTKPNHVR